MRGEQGSESKACREPAQKLCSNSDAPPSPSKDKAMIGMAGQDIPFMVKDLPMWIHMILIHQIPDLLHHFCSRLR